MKLGRQAANFYTLIFNAMSPKKFIIYILIVFPLLLTAHFLLVDNLVIQERRTPYSYKQFLLQSLSPLQQKVIVAAGSNAIHGIDSAELSSYFNAPAFTYADNANYPLRSKLLNIDKFSKPGDILILPIEWFYYSVTSRLSKNYTSLLADRELRLEFYYNNMPVIEKIRFIFRQYPLGDVISGLLTKRSQFFMLNSEKRRLSYFKNNIESGATAMLGNSKRNGPEDIVKFPKNNTCDSYLFSKGLLVSDEFKSNLNLLQKLNKKGLNIYFTWPAVVDYKTSACYTKNKQNFAMFHSEIKQTVANYGFKIIGDYQDSHFTSECFLNTYYHIKRECALPRTKKLVENLQHAGILPYAATEKVNVKQVLLEEVNLKLQENARDLQNNIPTLVLDEVKTRQLSNYLVFTQGWGQQEKWGLWSDGHLSRFNFKISKKQRQQKSIKITLNGRYFNGVENTGITINNKKYNSQPLTNAFFIVPTELIKEQMINIELKHHSIISPKELGLSSDARNLKFGLVSIKLESNQ